MARRKPPPPPAEDIVRQADEEHRAALGDLGSVFSIDASGPSELSDQGADIWVKASGWTPVEFLTHTYRNPYQKMSDRISAAKSVLDYAHRKLPQKLVIDAEVTGRTLSVDAAQLSKLSDKELEVLEKLLTKAGAA